MSAILGSLLKRYYFERLADIRAPARAPEREFGYFRPGSGMVRHISVRDDAGLRLLLSQNAPPDVYCSNAYYAFPELPMREKEWRGADLIFDVDAKDLALPCRADHAVRVCECSRVHARAECPHCGSQKSQARSLPCKKCIKAAWDEVEKLLKILEEDLGITGAIAYFSGNEGFHVHVEDPGTYKLGSKERLEIADYVSFRGAIPELVGLPRNAEKKKKPAKPAEPDNPGWPGRYARHALASKAARSRAKKEAESGGYQLAQARLAEAAPVIGARIDPGVTTDVHRIFRLAGTVNGKSGLSKIPWEGEGDPYEASALLGGDPREVVAECPVRFALGGSRFGPFEHGRVRVPAYAAAYMICKGLASDPA
ncbi:MAG: DNA primase [Nitrosopumilus sp.]|nr:DNA primase [Nitrosopumilus sp.]